MDTLLVKCDNGVNMNRSLIEPSHILKKFQLLETPLIDTLLAKCDDGVVESLPEPCPILKQFQLLQSVMNEVGLPSTVDRRDRPRIGKQNEITVVLLAELEETLNVFLEGNRQSRDGVLLVLTSNWISRDPSPDNPHLDTLYVHQAVTADAGGQTYLDVFSPPRRVTYLVNHLLGPTTEFRRTEGEELSAFGLDTPCSSSPALNYRTDDKLLTTTMCAAASVGHPVTLGFWLPGKHSHDYSFNYPNIKVVQLESRDQDIMLLQSVVVDFLCSDAMEDYEKVVVKPFGPTWNCCKGVTFHDRTDVPAVIQAVFDLLALIDYGTGILVQSYHSTFDPVVTPGLGRHTDNMAEFHLGFRVRAIVARTPQNNAVMTQIVCGVNDADHPIGGVSTVPSSFDLTLRQWGVTDVHQQSNIRESIRQASEKLMLELMRQETQLTAEERGGHGCQTDLLGIDIILTKQKDAIVPVVIEVNAHDCLYHVTQMEFIHPQKKGQAVGPFVRTMLARSQKFLMTGKVVLVIGAGGFSKRKLWKDAQEFGVKLVLVDSDAEHPAKSEVDMFLHVDIEDHTQDKQHAATIVACLAAQLPFIKVDGCLTFWEDCVPLAALIGEALNLRHCTSFQAAMYAKSKALTHKMLLGQAQEYPHALPGKLFASPQVKVDNVADVEKAVRKIPLPAVMKLEYGSSAVGVKVVRTLQEAENHVKQVHSTIQDRPGVGLGHGQSFVLMPLLLGSEHDVDVVMFEGRLMAAFISDNGPTRLPYCMETTATMPSVLPKEQQQHLVSAATSCCRGLGLLTGVFNVEMMLTPRGPRLIEINARMGGFYLRDWIRLVYEVDLLHMALMCACGIRPIPTCKNTIREDIDDHEALLMGIMLYPSRHREALDTIASPERLQQLHDNGVVFFSQLESEVDHTHDGFFDEPYANLAVKASNLEEARVKLISLCLSLGLESEEAAHELLRDFIRLS